MPKELIVSVNGREKKIAIIENERVTEFYIERGEEHQGIVGNIYKGRVMRVLPGMQSAFVDIGLERDAFLYVSDFFDEEEEFERIVMDKAKKGDQAQAQAAAQERIEQARIEREHHMEATQERAEPLRDAEPDILDAQFEDDIPTTDAQLPEPEETSLVAEQSAETFEEEGAGRGGRRGRRGRRRGKGSIEQPLEETAPQREATMDAGSERIQTPFIAPDSSFERVVDEEEAAFENGEMFKDARVQERIFDQIHAVEFDMEDVSTAEVGSLLQTGVPTSTDASFQRIDDSDVITEDQQRAVTPVQQTVAAHVDAFIDEITEETISAQPSSFERVSDDERIAEVKGVASAEEASAAKSGRKRATAARAGRSTTKKEARGRTSTKGSAQTEEQPDKPSTRKASGKKAASKTAAKKKPTAATSTATTARKSSSRKSSASSKGRSRRASGNIPADEGEADIAVLEDEAARAERTDVVAAEAADGGHFEAGLSDEASSVNESYEDAQASIKSSRPRSEFATRRGGRRRRRPPVSKNQESAHEDDRTNGKDDDALGVEAEESQDIVSSAPPPSPQQQRSGGRRSSGDRQGNGGRGSSGGGQQSKGGGQRFERKQPMITDLLREGQEILVQIAKEPIAKKGARITSHIALPGRFLVYMPTVEHVGVSRKIESDSERARLRKLIQLIRAEEDVPSGGFIVRTAGVGISEEDLRDDARYLVRTWLDIRRDAEKAKPKTLVHRDLDLVQRILRDQLSDDFATIRVDSEEEYLRIVEFINRIQPRMVKRVKLYTRDEPILEAFAVQAELDKAIKPRVWLKSGGYLVINQTEALVAIDVNTGKFVGRGGTRLEDTITKTNLEAVEEIVRQIRLRDLGGIIVLDLIDMEDRRNRNRVMQALQEALQNDKSPTKVLSFNDFGLVIMTRKRVKQSLERTLCSPCSYCQGAGLVKSPQTICYEILEEARCLSRNNDNGNIKQTTLRVSPEVARALRSSERDVFTEIEDYLGPVDITSDPQVHQEQFDFAFI